MDGAHRSLSVDTHEQARREQESSGTVPHTALKRVGSLRAEGYSDNYIPLRSPIVPKLVKFNWKDQASSR